jgi:lysophospholipase L1-like esterase
MLHWGRIGAGLIFALIGAVELRRWIWIGRTRRRRQARGEEHLRQHPLQYEMADALYGMRLRPGQYGPSFWINQQGFPQQEQVRRRRQNGTLRIVCLGESPTFGIDSVRSFPSFLQKTLERNSPSYEAYEVINAAVPGWSSDQTALRVKRELAGLKPHIVVLYMGFNDFQAYDPLRGPPAQSAFDQHLGPLNWGGPKGMIAPWRTAITLAKCAGRKWVRQRPAPASNYVERNPARLYCFLRKNLQRVAAFFRAANPNVKFIVCTLSAQWPKEGAEEWNVPPEVWWAEEHGLNQRETKGYMDDLNGVLCDFAIAEQAEVVDLDAVFSDLDRQSLFWDMGHLTSRGLEIIAGAIYQHMCHSGLVSGGPDYRYARLTTKYHASRFSPEH